MDDNFILPTLPTLRVGTYNVHSFAKRSGEESTHEIAELIKSQQLDVVMKMNRILIGYDRVPYLVCDNRPKAGYWDI